MARKKLLNIRSSAVNTTGGTTSPKLPTSEQIEYGEIAVNFAKGYETMAIRNNNDDIITFSNDKYWENIITDNEKVVAAAMNKLNSDIEELSGDVDTHISDTDIHVTVEDKERWDEGTQGIDSLSGKVDNIIESVDLNSDGTYKPLSDDRLLSGASSVSSALSIVSEVIVENEQIVASALDDLDARVIEVTDDLSAHTSDTTIHVTSADKSAWNAKQDELTAGTGIDITDNVISCTATIDVDEEMDETSPNPVANSAITLAIEENEEVVASALADLDERVIDVTDDLSAHTSDTTVHVTSADKTNWNNKVSNVQSDWNATSGLAQILNKPTSVSAFTNDEKYVKDEGTSTVSIIKGFGDEETVLASYFGAGNGAVGVNPGGVNIISNWDGYSNGNIPTGTNNVYIDTSLGKAYYNNNEIATISDLSAHTSDTTVHVTSADKANWNGKQNAISNSSSDLITFSGNTLILKNSSGNAMSYIASSSDVVNSQYWQYQGSERDLISSVAVNDNFQRKLTFDNVPTRSSENPVKSGGVFDGLEAKQNKLTASTGIAISGNNISSIGIPYGQVDTSSTSTAFTATVPGIDRLEDGVTVMLRNGVVNSASNFTININNLGAHGAYSNMTLEGPETTIFTSAYTMMFVYDSHRTIGGIEGAWICYRGYDTNTIGFQLRVQYGNKPVTDTARYNKIYFNNANNTKWIPASVDSTNNATSPRTPNQRPINPFGSIVYTTSTSAYTENSDLPAGYIWNQYPLNLGYSFGPLGTGLTIKTPVYLKCAPQQDGSAIIDLTTPVVQSLPTTEDGNIYIYLGIAYSTTNIQLEIIHPVYCYKDGAIRIWTNDIPVDQVVDSGSTNAISNAAVYGAINNISFDDLNDKPTKLSDFANDCNFATSGASLVRAYAGHVDDYLTNADASGESTDTDITQGTGDEALCFIYQISNGKYTLVALSIANYLDETFNVQYRVSTGNSISLAEMEIVECGTVTNPDFTLIVGDYDIGEYRCFFTCGANAMSITFNGVTVKWKDIPQFVLGDRYEISILRCSTNYYGVIIRYE